MVDEQSTTDCDASARLASAAVCAEDVLGASAETPS